MRVDHHGLVLTDLHRRLRVRHERGHIRTQEILPLAQTHNERRIMARADHDARLAAIHRQNRERALEHAPQAAHRLKQVGFARLRDHRVHNLAQQLGRHLGVGARNETVPLRLQVQTQLRGVLDDAVVDDRHLAVTARMRVRVHIVGHTVRGPTRMPDRHRGVRQRAHLDVLHQIRQAAGLLAHRHTVHTRRGQRHTGRIIPTVFQPFQALQAHLEGAHRRTIHIPCITYNSTHAHQHNRQWRVMHGIPVYLHRFHAFAGPLAVSP